MIPAQNRFTQFDLPKFAKLCRSREVLMKQMLALFIENAPENIELIEQGGKSNNKDDTSRYCHKLKGSLVNLAVNDLCEKLRVLESLSNSGQWEQFSELFGLVKPELKELLVEIKDFLSHME